MSSRGGWICFLWFYPSKGLMCLLVISNIISLHVLTMSIRWALSSSMAGASHLRNTSIGSHTCHPTISLIYFVFWTADCAFWMASLLRRLCQFLFTIIQNILCHWVSSFYPVLPVPLFVANHFAVLLATWVLGEEPWLRGFRSLSLLHPNDDLLLFPILLLRQKFSHHV